MGFVGTMMVTADALRVPSSCPVGNGTCDVGSGRQNICGGSIPSRSTSDIWELQGLEPCPGIRRLGVQDKHGVGWLLCWQIPSCISLCAHCCLPEIVAVVVVTREFAVCLDDE